MRWAPTDPMFSRWVTADVDFYRGPPPQGLGSPHLSRRRQPGSRTLGTSRRVRSLPAVPTDPGLRRGATRLPRAARGPSGNDRRYQCVARPAAESPTRSGCRTASFHRLLRAGGHGHPGPFRLTPATGGATLSEETYQPPDLMLLGEEHVQRYQETDGEVGYIWNGVPTLLLTTTGRKAGSRGRLRSYSDATATTTSWSPRWVEPRSIPTGTGTSWRIRQLGFRYGANIWTSRHGRQTRPRNPGSGES